MYRGKNKFEVMYNHEQVQYEAENIMGLLIVTSFMSILTRVLSWSWSYSSLQLSMQSVFIIPHVVSLNPAQARCTRYNIMWWSLLVTCDSSVVFSG
jgi:hypothetical protein